MEQLSLKRSMLFAQENRKDAYKILDGSARTKWVGGLTPAFMDINFDTMVHLQKVELETQKNSYCIFSVYTSADGENFSLCCKQTDEKNKTGAYSLSCDALCCKVRVYVQYDSVSPRARIRNLRLFGEPTAAAAPQPAERVVCRFDESEYNRPVTAKDTIDELHALVGRVLGEDRKERFSFELTGDAEEAFTLSDNGGKVHIAANSGVNCACGLGYYLKNYCSVHVSQVGCNTKMPETLPKIGKPLRVTTPYRTRYSYNYCALSYTMAFWGADEWQKELDLLALQGVNVILDITALEEVWRRFLCKLGYTNDEARAFITGPAYYAWFNMANIYGTGGPVPMQYFIDRTNLARRNHFFMRKMGMQPVLQGYSGMVPTDVKDYVPDASIILQGLWNGMDRPAMLRTNTDCYRRLAKLFYDSQKEVFGDPTVYFATDPFHEGGKAGAMNLSTVGKTIMQTLLDSYPDAVWILQSWGENPSRALVEGIAPWKEHVLILDLYAEKRPHWESFLGREFLATPWLYCMLNNFGGRMGLHGHLRTIATEIARASGVASCMRGIGVTPEATLSNPIIFDLFFETIWTTTGKVEPVNLKPWLRRYAERRYGSCSDTLYEAMLLLNDTVYNPDLNEKGEGAPESVINTRPAMQIQSASSWGNSIIAYDKKKFERAVELFAKDMEQYLSYEGYRFDLLDLLKQVLANTAQEYHHNLAVAYKAKDVIAFRKWADKFRAIAAYTDTLLAAEKTFTLGNWVNKAKARAAQYDDFSKMLFEFNARALITTWAGSRQAADDGGLRDYSNKQWAGLTRDLYAARWARWLKDRTDELEGKKPADPDWFRMENRWTWQTNAYSDVPAQPDLREAANTVLTAFSVDTAAQ